jgi:hypothetical protein
MILVVVAMPGLILRRSQWPSKDSAAVEMRGHDVAMAKTGQAIGV